MEKVTTAIVRFEVRLPLDIDVALKQRALDGDRSKNAQIVRALRYYLANAKGDE